MVYIFRDINQKAENHYLMIPKTHIRNINYVDLEHYDLIAHMQNEAYAFIKDNHPNIEV